VWPTHRVNSLLFRSWLSSWSWSKFTCAGVNLASDWLIIGNRAKVNLLCNKFQRWCHSTRCRHKRDCSSLMAIRRVRISRQHLWLAEGPSRLFALRGTSTISGWLVVAHLARALETCRWFSVCNVWLPSLCYCSLFLSKVQFSARICPFTSDHTFAHYNHWVDVWKATQHQPGTHRCTRAALA
jgi:hypothetical protein